MPKLTFKYRVYPGKRHKHLLEQTLEECRWVYNQTLAYRKTAWEERRESVSLYATHPLLPPWKEQRPSLQRVYAQVLQDVQSRVDLAFKGFFRRVKAGEIPGYPRFRGRGRYDSFTFPQSGFALNGEYLHLSKIGDIPIELHRPLTGKVKTLTMRRTATGKWFACFSVETDVQLLPASARLVGVDMGLTTFAALSDGTTIDNPRFFQRDERALGRCQRTYSAETSHERQSAKRKLAIAHVYERIANRRRDFAHKLSNQLVQTYGFIAFEDLSVSGMLTNHCLAKSIGDAAWQQTIRLTTYKAECAGRRVVLVSPRNTSQMCSRCDSIVEKTLSDRVHSCPACGLEIDRDLNAAINILRRGLASVEGTGPPESPRYAGK